MEGYGWVIFGGAAVFFGGLFAYLMFMIFLPEWVGITGPKALAAEASHRAPTPEEDVLTAAAISAVNAREFPSESVASELVPEAVRVNEVGVLTETDPLTKKPNS